MREGSRQTWVGMWVTVLMVCAFTPAQAQDSSPWVKVQVVNDERFTHFALGNLHFYDSMHGWAYGGGSPEAASAPLFILARTDDGGRTWAETEISREEVGIYLYPHFLSPRDGWTLAEDESDPLGPVRYFRTRDGGETWSAEQGEIVETVYIGDEGRARWGDVRTLSTVHFVNQQVGFMAGGLNDGYRGYVILSTRDGGRTWKALLFGATPHRRTDSVSGPGMPLSIDFVGDTHGWIAIEGGWPGNGRLFRTQDGGMSWDVIEFAEGERDSLHGRWIQFVTATDGWSAGGSVSRLMRTRDGGRTWEPTTLHSKTLLFRSATLGWGVGRLVNTQERQASSIFSTTDSGTSWTAEYIPERFDVDAVPWKVPFAGSNRRSWRLVYSPLTGAVWAIGSGGNAWLRTDAPTRIFPSGQLITTWARTKQ